MPDSDIGSRLARFEQTAHAGDLWPGVTAGTFGAAQRSLADATAAVLAGAPAPRLTPPPGVTRRALGAAAMASGMGPLLGFWVETGQVKTDSETAALLAEHLDHGRRRAARLDARLAEVLGAFAARGVEALLLKAADTAHRYFPEPGTRPANDVDLLVAPEHFAAAERALADLGYTLRATGVVRERHHWLLPDPAEPRSLDLTHADNPWSLDLHASLDRQVFFGLTATVGEVRPEHGVPWQGLGAPARVLPPPLLPAYLALHASLHLQAVQLVRLVELVLVARAELGGDAARWDAVRDLLAKTGAMRFVYPGLALAAQLAPGSVAARLVAQARAAAPARVRRLVDAMTPGEAHRIFPVPLGDQYVWAATPREHLLAWSEIVWPRDDGRLESPAVVVRRQWGRVRRLLRRRFR